MLFLTGANMAGKSTFMKSFGIAVYMTQPQRQIIRHRWENRSPSRIEKTISEADGAI